MRHRACGMRKKRRVSYWLSVMGYEGMRSGRRVPMLTGRRLQSPGAATRRMGMPVASSLRTAVRAPPLRGPAHRIHESPNDE